MGSQHIKVAMAQLLVEGGEPERNLDRAERMVEDAAKMGAEIVVLPEVLDLAWTHPSALNEAKPIPGPYSDRLCEAAKKYGIYICAGLTERLNGRVYNAAIFVDDQGEILIKYHKINLLAVEQPFYEVGTGLFVIETKWGRIGVNICADNYKDSLEIGHVLGRMGAQIILSPSSWTSDYSYVEGTDPYGDKWVGPFAKLAQWFNLVIIGVTSVGYIVGGPYEGKKMIGCSLAVGPNGIIKKGRYNEFAGDLQVVEFEVPGQRRKGTEIGRFLDQTGGILKI